MTGIGDLMKQAQQMQAEMQKRLQEAQQELAELEIVGESGAGLVRVTLNGRHEARRVQIDPSLLADDRELLEDLLAAAITDAAQKVEKASQERMSKLTGGMGLPPGFKLPF